MKHFIYILFLFSLFSGYSQKDDKYDRLSDSLIASGQKERLYTVLDSILKKQPKDEQLLRRLGHLSIKDGRLDAGESYYKQALVVNPNCARCYMNLANVEMQRNHKTLAMDYMNKAIAMDPKDASLYSVRAQFKEFNGEGYRAISDYNKAIELDPTNATFYLLRGEYNSKQGYKSLAISDYDKVIEIDPKNYRPYFEKASLYYEQRKMQEAYENIQKAIELDSSNYSCYTARGAVYAALGEYEKSVVDYSKAIQLDTEDPLPRYNRALSKYKLEDMDGACLDYYEINRMTATYEKPYAIKAEIDASFSDVCDSSRASYYYQRGIAYFNLNQYNKAVIAYTRGLTKFGPNPLPYSFRGNAYYAMNEYEKALADHVAAKGLKNMVEAEVKTNPRFADAPKDSIDQYVNGFNADLQLRIAESQFGLGRYKEALSSINEGIALCLKLPFLPIAEYYNVRGNIYMAQADYNKARQDFDRAIAADPRYFLPYVNRAITKINDASKTKTSITSVHANYNGPQFQTNWQIPVSTKVYRNDAALMSAYNDCNKALELEGKSSFAFYIRGHVKKLLGQGDFCADFVQAEVLGYMLEPEIKVHCTK